MCPITIKIFKEHKIQFFKIGSEGDFPCSVKINFLGSWISTVALQFSTNTNNKMSPGWKMWEKFSMSFPFLTLKSEVHSDK